MLANQTILITLNRNWSHLAIERTKKLAGILKERARKEVSDKRYFLLKSLCVTKRNKYRRTVYIICAANFKLCLGELFITSLKLYMQCFFGQKNGENCHL